jgi:hypothetical protein
VLYPGFWYPASSSTTDAKLAAALCRAYNNWLADYYKPYRQRLFGMALVPMQDIDEAVREMRRAVSELGLKGVVIRPSPHPAIGRNLHDPGESRGASQPHALAEPDKNLSIHPAPIIRPPVPDPSGRTAVGCGV